MTRYFKKISVVLYLLFCFASTEKPAFAVIGFGDTVFDSTNYIQQLMNYIVYIAQYYTQIEQYQHQIQQLQNEYQHLQSLNYRIDLSSLNDMRQVLNSATGMSNDFAHMQTQFQQLYPDFDVYKTQNNINYAQQAIKWDKLNQQNALDILKTGVKLQDSIYQDQNTLRYLSDRSDTASGTKDLLQIMNQLLTLETKQLMQMEQLMTQTAKTDASYLAEKTSKDAAESARYQQQIDTWNTTNNAVVNPNLGQLH